MRKELARGSVRIAGIDTPRHWAVFQMEEEELTPTEIAHRSAEAVRNAYFELWRDTDYEHKES